jgi:hypothetical protein
MSGQDQTSRSTFHWEHCPHEPVAIQLLNPMNHQTQAEERRFDRKKFGLFRVFDRQRLQMVSISDRA